VRVLQNRYSCKLLFIKEITSAKHRNSLHTLINDVTRESTRNVQKNWNAHARNELPVRVCAPALLHISSTLEIARIRARDIGETLTGDGERASSQRRGTSVTAEKINKPRGSPTGFPELFVTT